MKFLLPTFQVLGLALFAQSVNGHATLTQPAPRPSASGQIEKDSQRPPSPAQLQACANRPAGPTTAEFKAGETITVDWLVAAKHGVPPGVTIGIRYKDGEDMTELLTGADIDAHPTEVTLPLGKVSDSAVLVWLWDSEADGGFYLDCADVKVTAGGTQQSSVNPSGETAKPASETDKPAGETDKPAGETAKPASETAKPAGETDKPAGETAKPAGETAKPAGETAKPAGETANPAGETANPAGETAKPAGETVKPSAEDKEDCKDKFNKAFGV